MSLLGFLKPFIIETDALRVGLGAVLTQEEGPIAYFSQVLLKRARLKSVYERELMAIVLAVQKWQLVLVWSKGVCCIMGD